MVDSDLPSRLAAAVHAPHDPACPWLTRTWASHPPESTRRAADRSPAVPNELSGLRAHDDPFETDETPTLVGNESDAPRRAGGGPAFGDPWDPRASDPTGARDPASRYQHELNLSSPGADDSTRVSDRVYLGFSHKLL